MHTIKHKKKKRAAGESGVSAAMERITWTISGKIRAAFNNMWNNLLSLEPKTNDCLWFVMSRRKGISYNPVMSRLPGYLEQRWAGYSYVLLYPEQAKKYRQRISRMLDGMDYQGSMIYDEYPDRLALLRLAESVQARIRQEEEEEQGRETSVEDSRDRKTLIQILLYYEIFRRRRRNGRSCRIKCQIRRLRALDHCYGTPDSG